MLFGVFKHGLTASRRPDVVACFRFPAIVGSELPLALELAVVGVEGVWGALFLLRA